jgi:hypothetical protein
MTIPTAKTMMLPIRPQATCRQLWPLLASEAAQVLLWQYSRALPVLSTPYAERDDLLFCTEKFCSTFLLVRLVNLQILLDALCGTVRRVCLRLLFLLILHASPINNMYVHAPKCVTAF